jgi:histidinol phosphatase-like PHP family hydrolase
MLAVPESYARELGQVARETDTAIEINASANLKNPAYSERYVKEYIEFLSVIAEEGACFAFGSDAHEIGKLRNVQSAWEVAQTLKLCPDRIWRPTCRPLAGPNRSGKEKV